MTQSAATFYLAQLAAAASISGAGTVVTEVLPFYIPAGITHLTQPHLVVPVGSATFNISSPNQQVFVTGSIQFNNVLGTEELVLLELRDERGYLLARCNGTMLPGVSNLVLPITAIVPNPTGDVGVLPPIPGFAPGNHTITLYANSQPAEDIWIDTGGGSLLLGWVFAPGTAPVPPTPPPGSLALTRFATNPGQFIDAAGSVSIDYPLQASGSILMWASGTVLNTAASTQTIAGFLLADGNVVAPQVNEFLEVGGFGSLSPVGAVNVPAPTGTTHTFTFLINSPGLVGTTIGANQMQLIIMELS